MVSKTDSNKARLRRHTRVRGKVSGTAERPRLNVYRSLNHIYAQIIDDVKGVTLVAASSVEKDLQQLPHWTKSSLGTAETRKPLKRLAS